METGSRKYVVIAGGTGLVGRRLAIQFEAKGYSVRYLTRTPDPARPEYFSWDPNNQIIDERVFDQAEMLVNLAGEGIADKLWTPWRRRRIVNSRIFSTSLLYNTLKRINHNIKVVINASAIGIYGHTDDLIIHEDAPPSNDFLGATCQRWEKAAHQFESLGIRVVIVRIGLVLSTEGGMLKELLKPANFGFAVIFGTGTQYQSWIHIEDLCRIIVKASREDIYSGVYNAVAPGSLSQRNFMKLLSQIMPGHPFLIRIPAFILKLIMGEMSKMLTEGSRVSPEKLLKTDFKFNYPQANHALRNLLGK